MFAGRAALSRRHLRGRVAQLAEHSTLNRQVEGSIPSASTMHGLVELFPTFFSRRLCDSPDRGRLQRAPGVAGEPLPANYQVPDRGRCPIYNRYSFQRLYGKARREGVAFYAGSHREARCRCRALRWRLGTRWICGVRSGVGSNVRWYRSSAESGLVLDLRTSLESNCKRDGLRHRHEGRENSCDST